MARDNSPIVKQSRREGYALHPKAHKVMARKTGIPGQHAQGRHGKPSLYATQLREKQKVRRMYGLLEKQFSRLMNEATRMQEGLAGENLLKLLELRLDNAVYRAGFAVSRRGARQSPCRDVKDSGSHDGQPPRSLRWPWPQASVAVRFAR